LRARDRGAAVANSGLNGLGRVDELHVRGRELLDQPVRLTVEELLRVDPAHQLEVLARHPLSRQRIADRVFAAAQPWWSHRDKPR
jgi:hypothetical protein